MQPINPVTGSTSHSLIAVSIASPPPPSTLLPSPRPPLPHTHARIRTPPPPPTTTTTPATMHRTHCAHVPCPWVPITYFSVCIFLGRIVLHVTSARYYGVLQKVTRRREDLWMDAVMCASSQIRGRWDLCRCTPSYPPLTPSSALPPYTPTPPPFLALPPSLPRSPSVPSRWMGVSKTSALSPCRGRNQILQLPVPFKTWKRVSPIWWSCMIFLSVCALLWDWKLVAPCFFSPSLPHPGSAKSMAAELDKIRNGPNCV